MPHEHWKTKTLTGALKLTKMTATFVIELFIPAEYATCFTAAGYKPD